MAIFLSIQFAKHLLCRLLNDGRGDAADAAEGMAAAEGESKISVCCVPACGLRADLNVTIIAYE